MPQFCGENSEKAVKLLSSRYLCTGLAIFPATKRMESVSNVTEGMRVGGDLWERNSRCLK